MQVGRYCTTVVYCTRQLGRIIAEKLTDEEELFDSSDRRHPTATPQQVKPPLLIHVWWVHSIDRQSAPRPSRFLPDLGMGAERTPDGDSHRRHALHVCASRGDPAGRTLPDRTTCVLLSVRPVAELLSLRAGEGPRSITAIKKMCWGFSLSLFFQQG